MEPCARNVKSHRQTMGMEFEADPESVVRATPVARCFSGAFRMLGYSRHFGAGVNPRATGLKVSSQFGVCRSGIGGAENSRRHGAAMIRAQRAERFTRALSVAMPVLAYIWR